MGDTCREMFPGGNVCGRNRPCHVHEYPDEREDLRAQLARVTKERDEAVAWQQAKQEWIDVATRAIDGLNSKLTTAVMALEWYAKTHPSSSLYTWDVARKTLAAIRGMEVPDLAGRGASLRSGRGDPATRPDRPPSQETTTGLCDDTWCAGYGKHGYNPNTRPMHTYQEPAPECTCDYSLSQERIGDVWHDPNCPQHGRKKP